MNEKLFLDEWEHTNKEMEKNVNMTRIFMIFVFFLLKRFFFIFSYFYIRFKNIVSAYF